MFARMITATVPSDKLDEAVRLWESTVAPTTQAQEGFINTRVYVDRANGRIRVISLWESEALYTESIPWMQQQLAIFVPYFTETPVIESYELTTDAAAVLRARAAQHENAQE